MNIRDPQAGAHSIAATIEAFTLTPVSARSNLLTLTNFPSYTPMAIADSLEHCLGSADYAYRKLCFGNCTIDRCGVHQDLVANNRLVESCCRTYVGKGLGKLPMLKSQPMRKAANQPICPVSACRHS